MLKILTSVVRQKKEIESEYIGKEEVKLPFRKQKAWLWIKFKEISPESQLRTKEFSKATEYKNQLYLHILAPHSSTLAWKIPWMEESGRLQSMGSRGVRHDWATSLSLFTFMHWRRKWQPTAVFLPGESQGWGSLVGCRLWGRTESDTTEAT